MYSHGFRTEAKLETERFVFNVFGAGVFGITQALTPVHFRGCSALSLSPREVFGQWVSAPHLGALSIPLPPPREDFPDLNNLIALCKVWTVTSTQTLSSRAYNRLSTTFACVQWLSAGPFRPARRCHHKTWRWRPLDPCHRRCVSS